MAPSIIRWTSWRFSASRNCRSSSSSTSKIWSLLALSLARASSGSDSMGIRGSTTTGSGFDALVRRSVGSTGSVISMIGRPSSLTSYKSHEVFRYSMLLNSCVPHLNLEKLKISLPFQQVPLIYRLILWQFLHWRPVHLSRSLFLERWLGSAPGRLQYNSVEKLKSISNKNLHWVPCSTFCAFAEAMTWEVNLSSVTVTDGVEWPTRLFQYHCQQLILHSVLRCSRRMAC